MSDRDIQWIMERLPHRYPLLMLDRVIELYEAWGKDELVAEWQAHRSE